MGHIAMKSEYLALQKRLDQNPIGAPGNKYFFEILQELFTTEECRLAAAMPMKLSTAETIAKNAEMSLPRAKELLDSLTEKGLILDLRRSDGRSYYYLNPPMIGFFEFTMMRVRNSIDQKKVAKLMWDYLVEDPELAFMKMVSEGDTFMARPLVHEDALAPEVYSEVLDYEKASHLIETAGAWAEGICHCRHIKHHMGQPCDYPMEHCLSLGMAADYLVRTGTAKRIEKERALDILVYAREHNNVQMGDNVKNHPSFICNCCSCCCEMMEGFRTIPKETVVHSSNYLAEIDAEACNGCGKCAKACPVDLIELQPAEPTEKAKKRKKMAVVNRDLCLGCGVCYRQCKFDALHMTPIGVRVYTPDNMMEKTLVQAIERGKLQNMIFDNPNKVTHRVLNRVLKAILELPPAKRRLADQQMRSKFAKKMLDVISKGKDGWVTSITKSKQA